MFNKNNFCHVASNNRNEQKAGVFVYKTTDNLEAVETSGYFNEKIIDINLHDLILHVQYDQADKTKVSQNLLCVTERTLDNVKAELITSDWEKVITTWTTTATQAINARVKIDGTSVMTAPLKFTSGSMRGAIGPYLNGVGFWKMDSQGNLTQIATLSDTQFLPATTNAVDIGSATRKWKTLYIGALNNGYDIAVPVTAQAETLALKSEVDLAANSGRMITAQGVWYAKTESATVAPAADNGTNYADFTQVDGQGNPIIVIYERQSGAWVQTDTITPPAEYDGYVPITSKIWDIAEQAGQQGGRIMWNHQSKEFTPYPLIVSFQDIEVTGTSTVVMPANPGTTQIVNKNYVDNAVAAVLGFDLFDTKWRDATTSNSAWLLSDGNWKTNATAFNHLVDDYEATKLYAWYWTGMGYVYTKSATPAVGDVVYDSTGTAVSTVETYDDDGGGWYITIVGDNTKYRRLQSSDFYLSQTETIAGTTITYYQAADGHKIILPDQETNANTIYTATGVAWYYILDTANSQFKLPISKHNKYANTLGVVGNGTTLGLTDGTNNLGLTNGINSGNYWGVSGNTDSYGKTVGTSTTSGQPPIANTSIGVTTDPTKSGIIAQQTQDTDQYKYLYFYVG